MILQNITQGDIDHKSAWQPHNPATNPTCFDISSNYNVDEIDRPAGPVGPGVSSADQGRPRGYDLVRLARVAMQ